MATYIHVCKERIGISTLRYSYRSNIIVYMIYMTRKVRLRIYLPISSLDIEFSSISPFLHTPYICWVSCPGAIYLTNSNIFAMEKQFDTRNLLKNCIQPTTRSSLLFIASILPGHLDLSHCRVMVPLALTRTRKKSAKHELSSAALL